MGEKKILKQKGDYLYFEDGSKQSIDEYRKEMKKAPRKKAVQEALKKSKPLSFGSKATPEPSKN